MNAIDEALKTIAAFEDQGLITPEIAQRSRDLVLAIFAWETIVCSIAPDDDGICFYWRAGEHSITIDLYPDGGGWQCVRNGPHRWIKQDARVGREMRYALADFTEMVESINPNWRELVTAR